LAEAAVYRKGKGSAQGGALNEWNEEGF
jgi:hypothetical protein